MDKQKPITTDSEWTFERIDEYYHEIEKIAVEEFGLDCYPNQIEVIGAETMLDAYTSVGMPINYSHWSFGKSFVRQQEMYKRGQMGLAYEIVINSSPCISYLMEENTMMMQILVMAHACFGHNAFFKNNYLFKEWTEADAIIDYLVYAKKYISECEERYGMDEVEELLDSCHALQSYGVDKYKRPPQQSEAQEQKAKKEREEYIQSTINEIWNTIPNKKGMEGKTIDIDRFPTEPQENILYFMEKNAPNMPTWKREIIRIVRKVAQYFYPQGQTKVMNEGFATFMHYEIVNRLYDKGLIDDGFMMEFLRDHTSVTAQPGYDSPYYNGINPYALGFAMFRDIKRICMEPTEEDEKLFDFAGNGDWLKTVKFAMESFKDESFIQQFLSPTVARDLKLFAVMDDDNDPKLEVTAIHNDRGFRDLRMKLAEQYGISTFVPNIQVYDVDVWGDRSILLQHQMFDRRPLDDERAIEVMKHVRQLWGYDVIMESVSETGQLKTTFEVTEDDITVDVFIDDD